MRTIPTLLALTLFGCVANVDELGNAGVDGSVANDAGSSIIVPVSQVSDGYWHRFNVADSCQCPGSQHPVAVACLQCVGDKCQAFVELGQVCNGCDDCFATCHSIYLTDTQAPVITFEFEYSCHA